MHQPSGAFVLHSWKQDMVPIDLKSPEDKDCPYLMPRAPIRCSLAQYLVQKKPSVNMDGWMDGWMSGWMINGWMMDG
jgi:hypothetical protein